MSATSLMDAMILQNKLGLGLTFDDGQVRAYYVNATAELNSSAPSKQYWVSTGKDIRSVLRRYHGAQECVSDNANRTLTACVRAGYHFALERQTFDYEPSDGLTAQISLSDVPHVIMWGVAPIAAQKRQVYVVGVDTVSDAFQIMAMRLENTPEDR